MGLLKVVDFAGLLVAMLLLFTVLLMGSVSGIGVNWGTQATHPLPPATVVKMLRDNGFQTVKLFDADSTTLNALKNSGIQVMVGIPNDMLYTLANSVKAAENWVAKNVSAHVSSNGVDIRYILSLFIFLPLLCFSTQVFIQVIPCNHVNSYDRCSIS